MCRRWSQTPSHGGIWLSADRVKAIPAARRAFAARWSHGFGDQWYEEDMAAAAVIAAWPDVFDGCGDVAAVVARIDAMEGER